MPSAPEERARITSTTARSPAIWSRMRPKPRRDAATLSLACSLQRPYWSFMLMTWPSKPR